MKRGLLLLLICWAIFAAYVWQSGAQLPERVATHFGMDGRPNDWMTRETHVRFTILAGLGIPAFILGIFALIRHMGDGALNIPHKDYWLAPERRDQTYAFIQRQGVILSVMLIAFLAGIHWSILSANTRKVVSLPGSDVGWVAGSLMVATVLWTVVFVGRFYRKPA